MPSAQPLNKYFPIIKKTKEIKTIYETSFKKIYVKINGGKNIKLNESFGKTSFQYPNKVDNEAAKAGTKVG